MFCESLGRQPFCRREHGQHGSDLLLGVGCPLEAQAVHHFRALVFLKKRHYSVFSVPVHLPVSHELFKLILGNLNRGRILAHMLRFKNVCHHQDAGIFCVGGGDICQFDLGIFVPHDAHILLLADRHLDTQQLLLKGSDPVERFRNQDLPELRRHECLFPGLLTEVGREHRPHGGTWKRERPLGRCPLGFQGDCARLLRVCEVGYRFPKRLGNLLVL